MPASRTAAATLRSAVSARAPAPFAACAELCDKVNRLSEHYLDARLPHCGSDAALGSLGACARILCRQRKQSHVLNLQTAPASPWRASPNNVSCRPALLCSEPCRHGRALHRHTQGLGYFRAEPLSCSLQNCLYTCSDVSVNARQVPTCVAASSCDRRSALCWLHSASAVSAACAIARSLSAAVSSWPPSSAAPGGETPC